MARLLQRAQELKMIQNLEKGNHHKSRSFAFESNTSLKLKAQCVDIKLGINTCDADKVIDNLKSKERMNLETYVNNNPEVILPSNLDVEDPNCILSPHSSQQCTPLKDSGVLSDRSWAQIVSEGLAQDNTKKHLS